MFRFLYKFLDFALIYIDNHTESWSKHTYTAGGVARCSKYLFSMRSPGSNPPFRGFTLYPPRYPNYSAKRKTYRG